MCEITYHFITILRPNEPKTNQNCQRIHVFVFMTVQGRMLHKRTQNTPNRSKTSTSQKKSTKVKARVSKVKDCSESQHWSSYFAKVSQTALGFVILSYLNCS